jgi:hypothetical protein
VLKSANFFFAPPGDLVSAAQGIAVTTLATVTVAVLVVLVVLLRPETGVLPDLSSSWLLGGAAGLALLAYGVHRRLRSAAVLLVAVYLLATAVLPLPRPVGILLTLFAVGGARGAFVLRSNPSLERP